MAAQVQLEGLRRQLEGLQYDAAGLTPACAPLVAALLGDLVRATDSYCELKGAAAEAQQASQTLQYQVRSKGTLRRPPRWQNCGVGAGRMCAPSSLLLPTAAPHAPSPNPLRRRWRCCGARRGGWPARTAACTRT